MGRMMPADEMRSRGPGRALLVLVAWLSALAAQLALPAQANAGTPQLLRGSTEQALLLEGADAGEGCEQNTGNGDDADGVSPSAADPCGGEAVSAPFRHRPDTTVASATSSYDARGPPLA